MGTFGKCTGNGKKYVTYPGDGLCSLGTDVRSVICIENLLDSGIRVCLNEGLSLTES
jgi:hypothetical protein